MDQSGRPGCHAGNLDASVTRDCLALAKSKGATTVLNPSPTYGAGGYDWSAVDLVLVNRGEAVDLAGGEAEEAARELCKKGAGAVVLTLGADGAAFVSAGDMFGWRRLKSSPSTRLEPATSSAGSSSLRGHSGATGETPSVLQRNPLRFLSRERVFSLPFRPGRRWRISWTRTSTPEGD
jgi:pfkB family carbohydrate kinase